MTVQQTPRTGTGRHRATTTRSEVRVRLREPAVCRLCGDDLPERAPAVQEPAGASVRCVDCEGVSALSTAARHRDDVDGAHPAVGHEQLRAMLDDLWGYDVRALHGRRVPGSQETIDHVVVSPGGVWVVDARLESGRPRIVPGSGLRRTRDERLVLGRRSAGRLLDGVLRQAGLVRDVVGAGVPVHPALCLLGADWPGAGADELVTRGVSVLDPARLEHLVTRTDPVQVDVDVPAVRQRLAVAFRVV